MIELICMQITWTEFQQLYIYREQLISWLLINPLCFIFSTILSILIFNCGALFLFHTFLMTTGHTTYELFHTSGDDDECCTSQYSEGFIFNILKFLLYRNIWYINSNNIWYPIDWRITKSKNETHQTICSNSSFECC